MKAVKEAYIGYRLQDGSEAGIKLHTMKNIDPTNSYKTDYIRFIANAFNFVLGRLVYWNDRNNHGKNNHIKYCTANEGRTDGHLDSVIITDYQLSENIGCSQNHSTIVMNQVRDLFGLEYKREAYRGGARTITINKQVIDFLNVYTDDQLTEYMMKYNIKSAALVKAIQQVFRYRVWAIKDTQLTKDIREDKKSFLKRFKNYLHMVATSRKSVQARINYVRTNKHLLTEKQLMQLDAIIELNQEGRLEHYWFSTLIKLEQKVSAHAIDTSNKKEEQTHSLTNGNQTEGNTEAQKSAAKVSQKIPPSEDDILSDQELQEFQNTWNKVAESNEIPRIEILTSKRIQSINEIVKIYSKEKLNQAVQNINNLIYNPSKSQYKMTFERLMRSETFVMVLESSSNNMKPDIEIGGWFEDYKRENNL